MPSEVAPETFIYPCPSTSVMERETAYFDWALSLIAVAKWP